jgi:flavin reductase (DIM6/NTAB) family NADH-FMN oxidoreductase RutF
MCAATWVRGSPCPRPAAPSPAAFRTVLGRFTTGVTVTTTLLDGAPYGITVNPFTSVSLRPPLVLACIRRGSRFLQGVAQSRRFAVNLLGEEQLHVATYFAANDRRQEDVVGIGLRPGAFGMPLIEGSVGWIECALWRTVDGGDHVICLGRVELLDHDDDCRPLLFDRGRFAELGLVWRPPDAREPEAWPWI